MDLAEKIRARASRTPYVAYKKPSGVEVTAFELKFNALDRAVTKQRAAHLDYCLRRKGLINQLLGFTVTGSLKAEEVAIQIDQLQLPITCARCPTPTKDRRLLFDDGQPLLNLLLENGDTWVLVVQLLRFVGEENSNSRYHLADPNDKLSNNLEHIILFSF